MRARNAPAATHHVDDDQFFDAAPEPVPTLNGAAARAAATFFRSASCAIASALIFARVSRRSCDMLSRYCSRSRERSSAASTALRSRFALYSASFSARRSTTSCCSAESERSASMGAALSRSFDRRIGASYSRWMRLSSSASPSGAWRNSTLAFRPTYSSPFSRARRFSALTGAECALPKGEFSVAW